MTRGCRPRRRGRPAAPRPRSPVKIEPDRPYSVSLASATASSSSSNGITATTGPKTSSRQIRVVGSSASHDRRRHPAARRRPGVLPVNATVGLVEVALHASRAGPRRSAAPSRWPRRRGRAPASPRTAGSSTAEELVVRRALRPGSGSGRSSPGRRCRRRRTAPIGGRGAMSASAKTMLALLPPSSRVTRFTWSAQPAMICLPTSVDPVKQTLRTSGWVTNRSPTTDPLPGITVKHALGQAGLEGQLAEPDRGQRGELGRLEHDGVAGGERRGEAPAGDRHREVPRHDDRRRRRAARGRSGRRRRRPGSAGRTAAPGRPE